ncbi:oligosaccharide flippase family protein [Vibrio splendidus]|uniref:oligosaccharide flippase family protein n=1 Tax=Vibrio splendidus TaxID=29497 RepID=UPI001FB2FCCF|nr:oligosaccharide flippase family protein [Vibrio splendidus]UOE80919.1 oligosaccharide flippase family protein [Vibrio splendidus]
MSYLKKSIRSAYFWSLIDNVALKALSLIVVIIMARNLDPSDFGIIAISTSIISIGEIIVTSGVRDALLFKKNRSERDYQTAFLVTFITSIFVYLLIFFMSEPVANYYDMPELVFVLKIMPLTLVIGVFALIPRFKFTLNINMKSQAVCSLVSFVLSSSIGIFLVVNGYGIWALIVQFLLQTTIIVLMMNILSPWLPMFRFNIRSFKAIYGYSFNVLLVGLINSVFNNFYTFFVGFYQNASSLGFFNRASTFSSVPFNILGTMINQVSHPILIRKSDNIVEFNEAIRRKVQVVYLLIFPVFGVFFIRSDELILLLLGKDWEGMSVYFSILSIGWLMIPLNNFQVIAFKSFGGTRELLYFELFDKVLIIFGLYFFGRFDIVNVCWTIVVAKYLKCTFMGGYLKAKYSFDFFGVGFLLMSIFLVFMTFNSVFVTILLNVGLNWNLLVYSMLSASAFYFISVIFGYLRLSNAYY